MGFGCFIRDICVLRKTVVGYCQATRIFQKMPRYKRPFAYSIYLCPKSGFEQLRTQRSILEVYSSVCIGI